MDDVKAVIEQAADAAMGIPTEAPAEAPKPEIGTPPEAPSEAPTPEMDTQPEAPAEAPKTVSEKKIENNSNFPLTENEGSLKCPSRKANGVATEAKALKPTSKRKSKNFEILVDEKLKPPKVSAPQVKRSESLAKALRFKSKRKSRINRNSS